MRLLLRSFPRVPVTAGLLAVLLYVLIPWPYESALISRLIHALVVGVLVFLVVRSFRDEAGGSDGTPPVE